MKRSVERSRASGWVADEQQPSPFRGQASFDGLVDLLGDAGGFVDDEEDVPFVEALEPFWCIGRETECEITVADLECGPCEGSADQIGVFPVNTGDLAP